MALRMGVVQFHTGLVHLLEQRLPRPIPADVFALLAAEVGPGPILSAVFALLVAAFALSVLLVGAGGFVALAILPPSFRFRLLDCGSTAYLFMNSALLLLALLLMFLSVALSRGGGGGGGVPRSLQRPSTAVAEILLSRALNVSIAAVFLSACVLIHLTDGERQG